MHVMIFFKWFSENRKLGNMPQYYVKLPRIHDEKQEMPDNPKSGQGNTSSYFQKPAEPINSIQGKCLVCGEDTKINPKTGRYYLYCYKHNPNNNNNLTKNRT